MDLAVSSPLLWQSLTAGCRWSQSHFRESHAARARARTILWTEPRIVYALASAPPAGQQAEPGVRRLRRREAACRRASSRPRTMDNILKAFEKCLASIVTIEQVSLPLNTVRVLSCPAPPHCAFTARRSLSHAACRGQPAVGPTAERRLWTSFPHGCWHGDRRSTTTTASLRPGCRALRPHQRGTDRLEPDAQWNG